MANRSVGEGATPNVRRPDRPSLRDEQKELTRQRLIDSAVEVFEEKGYLSTTIGDITNRANVSRATFYLHFDTKRDVAIGNGDQLVNRVEQLFPMLAEGPGVDADRALDFLHAWVEIMHQRTQEAIVAYQANVADAGLTAKGWQDCLALGKGLLAEFLAQGWQEIDPDAATRFAILIPSTSYALWGQGIFRIDPPHDRFMASLAQTIVDTVAACVRRPIV